MLLLDLKLSTFQHGEQLRRGLSHPLHVVVKHKAFVARGKRLQHPINRKFIWNLTFQSMQALNVARHFDHVLTHVVVLVHLSREEGFRSLASFSPGLRCKDTMRSAIISYAPILSKCLCNSASME